MHCLVLCCSVMPCSSSLTHYAIPHMQCTCSNSSNRTTPFSPRPLLLVSLCCLLVPGHAPWPSLCCNPHARPSCPLYCPVLLRTALQKDIILHDNDADLVVLNPDWDALLPQLKARLPGFRVFFVVPSEDTSIRWIRVMTGIGIMDLVSWSKDVHQGCTSFHE